MINPSSAFVQRSSLSGRSALVIGAGGLGSRICHALTAFGAQVTIADHDDQRAQDVARETGPHTHGAQVDVADPTQLDRLRDDAIERFGAIDILVNSAGITHLDEAEHFPLDQWHQIIAVNLTGVFLACRSVGEHMLQRGRGAIVNLSSIAGSVALRNTIAYCASKGGVDQLTRSFAIEWAERGVRVNAVAPSWFETDMGARLSEIEHLVAERLGRVPLGRMGQADELATAVAFLASDAASMITGAILPVDGGFLAQ